MADFAEFTLDGERREPLSVTIAPLSVDDVQPCAQLAATREGDPADPWVATFTRALGDDRQLVLVAHHRGTVTGYGKASWMELPAQTNAPTGWYLTGVVVDPAMRRRGIGDRLTRERLEVLQRRGADRVWFFANARNQVSLALHAQLGFRELTRDFTIPGVTFDGSEGVLAQWDAPA